MPFKDKEAHARYMRDYRRVNRKSVNPAVNLPEATESMLEAVNVVLERKGIPKVRKGVSPSPEGLPFDKKVQASRKRMA